MLTVVVYSLSLRGVFFLFDIVLTSITLDFNAGRVKHITRLVEVLPVKFQGTPSTRYKRSRSTRKDSCFRYAQTRRQNLYPNSQKLFYIRTITYN